MAKFVNDGISIEVKGLPADKESWVSIQSASVEYDKRQTIIDKFAKDWPEVKLFGNTTDEKFDLLSRLASRSPDINEWLGIANIYYSDTTQMPLWLKEYVEPGEYRGKAEKLLLITENAAKYSNLKNEAAREFQAKIKKLDKDQAEGARKIVGGDKILKVISLDARSLPVSLQLAIEGYTPADKELDIAESRRVYTRELLIQFKRSLLTMLQEHPEVDIDKYVLSIRSK